MGVTERPLAAGRAEAHPNTRVLSCPGPGNWGSKPPSVLDAGVRGVWPDVVAKASFQVTPHPDN